MMRRSRHSTVQGIRSAARTCALVALVGCLPLAGNSYAQYAGGFAHLGFGARGVALGSAGSADMSGESSAYYNPALSPFATGQQLEMSAALLRFDRQLQFLQFTTPLQPRAGIAGGLVHAGVSNIDGRDNNGFHTEQLEVDEFAFFLAFGLKFHERFSGGLSLQLFRSDISNDVSAETSIGVDIGFAFGVTENLSFGVVVDDLLAKYTWDSTSLFGDDGQTTTDDFPVRLKLSAAYSLMEGRLKILGEYESVFATAETRRRIVELVGAVPVETIVTDEITLQENEFHVGGEYLLNSFLTARAGFNTSGRGGAGSVSPSAGFMVEQPIGSLRTRFEYAFALEQYGVGGFHVLSIRLFL